MPENEEYFTHWSLAYFLLTNLKNASVSTVEKIRYSCCGSVFNSISRLKHLLTSNCGWRVFHNWQSHNWQYMLWSKDVCDQASWPTLCRGLCPRRDLPNPQTSIREPTIDICAISMTPWKRSHSFWFTWQETANDNHSKLDKLYHHSNALKHKTFHWQAKPASLNLEAQPAYL